jgi:hypothetical protein
MQSVRYFMVALLFLLVLTATAQVPQVKFTTKALEPNRFYKDIATITVMNSGTAGAAATPVPNQKLAVRVIGSDAVIVEGTAQKTDTTVKTGPDGKATVSLLTQAQASATLDIVPLNTVDGKDVPMDGLRRQFTLDQEELGFEDSLFSRRVFTEVFLGSTFTNDYKTTTEGTPPVTTTKSTGFSEAAPTARVTFDTIWPGNVTEDDETTNRTKPLQANMFRGSLVHSGINMQFASFPFGKGLGKDPDKEKGFDDAFTGSLYVLWQPNYGIFRSYTRSSTRPGVRFDAMRIGILALAGMTTRARPDRDGDTTIRRTQLGFKFTHHQTKKGTPELDQENTVPIRFIEITWGHFEQYGLTADGKDPRKGANRLMIDAGVRLPGMGGNLVPFYAGIHFNGGPGADDLRIFAGFLFKVNEIARAFQRADTENRP